MRSMAWLCGLAMVGGCGDEARPADAEARDDVTDTSADLPDLADGADGVDAADADDDADLGTDAVVVDVTPDADAADVASETDAPTSADGFCLDGAACNALLAEDGRCPGACLAQETHLRCKGFVVGDLCQPLSPPTPTPPDTVIDGLIVHLREAPPPSLPGDVRHLRFGVENPGGSARTVPFSSQWEITWEVVSDDFSQRSSLTIAAHATLELEATLRALRPDRFDLDQGHVVTLYVADFPLMIYAGIGFPPDAGIACGASFFPAQYCRSEGCVGDVLRYDAARCCDGVFFPAVDCCDSADCATGTCVDGECVSDVPRLNSANSLVHGTQSILYVLADFDELAGGPSADPCTWARSAELREMLQLDAVDDWFGARPAERTGRDLVDFRWTVRAGIDSDDFLAPDADTWVPSYQEALEGYFADAGCPIVETYDKLVMASPRIDLQGYGGQYLNRGIVAVGTWQNPYLLVHELGHSFGATDLYFDMAGFLLRQLSLMGDYLAAGASDDVMWGEVGWGDTDRDGVIDIFEFAAHPDALALRDLHAHLGPYGDPPVDALFLSFRVVALEGARELRVPTLFFDFDLPEHGYARSWAAGGDVKELVVLAGEIHQSELVARGAVDLHVALRHGTTDADGTHRVLVLDETHTIPLE
ncbi:MAG: hypothetical protein U1F43_17070 [Myxococcota bacterium]